MFDYVQYNDLSKGKRIQLRIDSWIFFQPELIKERKFNYDSIELEVYNCYFA